jgi:hypothetical protein
VGTVARVQVDEARQILGVTSGDDPDAVRAAYRRLLRRTHPDVSAVPDATDLTVRLTEAYAVLVRDDRTDGQDAERRGPPPSAHHAEAPPPAPRRPPIEAGLVDGDTIAVAAPRDETLFHVIEAAYALGEIGYLDPSAGLVEVIVEFVEAPTSSVLLTLQGRATGVTDVFCTVEPLSGGEAPPADAVTRLVLATLLDLDR